jgi:hypothetical protein
MEQTVIKYSEESFSYNGKTPILKKINIPSLKKKITSIELKTIPEFLEKVTIYIGGASRICWSDLKIDENLLKNHPLSASLLEDNEFEFPLEIVFEYNQNNIYSAFNECSIEVQEVMERTPFEDREKTVEYWCPENQMICQAFGVKYQDVKVHKWRVIKNIELFTPEFIIY